MSDEGGKAMLQIDDEKAAIVRQIFAEYLADTPIYLVYKKAKELGLPRSGHSAIHNLLSDYVYAGLVKMNARQKKS